jgi:serine/threonine-protein kinase
MEKIGRYQIIGELGRGAMGVVYRATDPAIGRTIAIKTIRLSELTEPSERERLRERLLREAQSAGILSHPGIVTIYDIQEQADVAYIFMEFVNGPPLEKLLLSDNPPDREMIQSIFRQTAAGLDYAHKKGIVHRDIKPANIMIGEDGAAKITDFGVAKIVSQQMTQAGTMMGTPNYMSPEQIQGQPVDGRADQFSLAVIAYELLTGEKPFSADYLPTLLYKIVREDPLPPQRLNPTLSPKVEEVFKKALAKNAADRYSACSDFIKALEVACAVKKDWKPLSRGASQNLPTVAGTAPATEPASGESASAAGAPMSLPPARKRRGSQDDGTAMPQIVEARGRGLKLMWVIATVLLLGVLAAAGYRWATSAGAGSARQQEVQAPATTPNPPPPAPAPELNKPSPAGAPVERAATDQPAPVETRAQPAGGIEQPVPVRRPDIQPPPAAKEIPVQVTSNPPGTAIVFDGNSALTCTTPCSINLAAGRHTFIASHDGYRRATRVVELPRDASISFDMDPMAGTLMVRTNPPGATIFIDGKEHPQKSPAMIRLSVGKYRVAVAKEGFAKDEGEVVIKDNAVHDLTFNWQ